LEIERNRLTRVPGQALTYRTPPLSSYSTPAAESLLPACYRHRMPSRLLKARRSVILRPRRFCATEGSAFFGTRKQQILRYAQDDTSKNSFRETNYHARSLDSSFLIRLRSVR
jgi:hypothetical protein